MKPAEAWETVRLRPPKINRTERVLGRTHSMADLQRECRRALPAPVRDYLEGGSDEETTLRANIAAFRRWRFTPNSLVDASAVDLRQTLLGRDIPLPLILSPTGYTRMFHPRGELEVADAANECHLPYVVSTVATTGVEDVAAVMSVKPWLQLYLLRDRTLTWDLLDRAWDSGVRVLEFSVDTAVSGKRTRDLRHGLTIPPSLGVREIAEIATRPRYWTNMLASPAMEFANLRNSEGASIREITSQFESALTWADLETLRGRWKGHILVKGPLSAADASTALQRGADGIHLSNHGGRQLDRCIPPIDLVEPVRQANPETPIIVDSGVRHGMDIAIAVALGADAVGVGRAYLYGLAAAGSAGVVKACGLLAEEYQRTLQLTGMTSTTHLRAAGHEVLST